jgi:hypothetical protein
MGLEIFIIPLIALAVWILQYIFRGPEEKKPAGKPGARPGSTRPTASRPARRQTTDLDRYLEETRKRRQMEETKPVVVAEVVQEKTAAERTEEMQRERRQATAPPKPPPPRPQRQTQRIPTVLPETPRRPVPPPPPAPAPRPVVAQPVPVPVVGPVEEPRVAARVEQPAAALDSRRREQRQIAAAPVQMELARLLKSKNGLAAVFVLQEIFGQPISRRPHR